MASLSTMRPLQAVSSVHIATEESIVFKTQRSVLPSSPTLLLSYYTSSHAPVIGQFLKDTTS